jgi:hypothetical protein
MAWRKLEYLFVRPWYLVGPLVFVPRSMAGASTPECLLNLAPNIMYECRLRNPYI